MASAKHYWKFDEGSGTVFYDEGTGPYLIDGQLDPFYNSVDWFVDTPNVDFANPYSVGSSGITTELAIINFQDELGSLFDFSLLGWFKGTAQGMLIMYPRVAASSGDSWGLNIIDDSIHFSWPSGVGQDSFIEVSSGGFGISTWGHFGVTLENGQFLKFYINGVLDNSVELSDYTPSQSRRMIEAFKDNYVDDLRFFDLVLSEGEIQAIADGAWDGNPFNSMSLYVGGGIPSGTIPLYTYGQDNYSGELTLFLQNDYTAFSGELPLFISSDLHDSIPLYTYGQSSHSGEITLFLQNDYTAFSGELPLFTQGHSSGSSGIPLYINGITTSSSGIPLYLCNKQYNDNIPLYIGGTWPSGNVNLFIEGYESINDNITLYIEGAIPVSGQIPLYIAGHEESNRSLNLYLQGEMPYLSYGFLDLSLTGTSQSGVFGGIPLFLEGTGGLASNLNLYLQASDTDIRRRYLNLFIGGGAHSIDDTVPLFICNTQSGVVDDIPLYIRGFGELSGALPFSSNMNLFIQRNTVVTMPLFLACSTPQSGGFPLLVWGNSNTDADMSLAMPYTAAEKSNSTNLYTHGF